MTTIARVQHQNWIVPKIYLSLVALLLVAQLIIITALGVSFKGPQVSTLADLHERKTLQSKMPPRHLSANKRSLSAAPALPYQVKPSSLANIKQSPKTKQEQFPLLNNPTEWPPLESKAYPDMELYNQEGKLVRLSNLTGKIIVVQPVAMGCPMSQAYSGANKPGMIPFGLCFPNPDTKAFDQRMFEYTGITMDSPELVFVQILLYNMREETPSVEDAKRWAKHFDLRTSRNQYVLVGTPQMTAKSRMLVPGFHLIDRSFNLRSDSTGLLPKRSLYNHFFPTLERLLPTATAKLHPMP